MRPSVSLRQLLPIGLLAAICLTGCQAERAIIAPVEPEWSYHDGDEQLSNNDTWNKMILNTAHLRADDAKVARREEAITE